MARIAIIGTGISGMAAAFLLNRSHDITVYEKAPETGGHTRTRTIDYKGHIIAVDTGFIVFNHRNYPNLSALFAFLKVPVQKSDMSFGVTADNGGLEWSAASINGLFGQRRNLANPKFLRFLLDVVRFNRNAVALTRSHPDATLGQLLAKMRLSRWFADYYLLPMGGAIWSCSLEAMLEFPAATFVDFFEAHGLLTVTRQPQWYTVTGGSREYMRRLISPFADRIRTSCAAKSVTRTGGGVQVADSRGERLEYNHVVLACHGDESLTLLQDVSEQERESLGVFRYQRNLAVLHRDESIMPRRRPCWASWIYHGGAEAGKDIISVTYWMNRLQGIDKDYPLFVTLNPQRPIPANLVFDEHWFEHPVYSRSSATAQQRLGTLQGIQNTWFCGAYLRNGFHEDGLASAIHVARQLGAEVPWQ